jgi:hypothetical protein
MESIHRSIDTSIVYLLFLHEFVVLGHVGILIPHASDVDPDPVGLILFQKRIRIATDIQLLPIWIRIRINFN